MAVPRLRAEGFGGVAIQKKKSICQHQCNDFSRRISIILGCRILFVKVNG